MKTRRIVLALVVAIVLNQSADAQQAIPIRALAPATARSREPMSDIIELKELPGGRVLVNLPFQLRLILLDSALVTVRSLIDTIGSGPTNYPNKALSLVPFREGSALFPDLNAGSFIVINPSGELGRAIAPPNGRDFSRMSPWQPGGKSGTDAFGRVVYQVSAPLLPLSPES